MSRSISALALVLGLVWAAPVRADDTESAAALFTSGMKDLAAKRYVTACPALRKSYRLDARAETLFRLAECEEGAGHITSAAAAYDDYLALYDRITAAEQQDERDRMREAVKRRELLERDIPKVTFKLPGTVPEGYRVTRRLSDGGETVDVALGVPLPIDPGEHYVATQAPDRPAREKRFFIHRGEKITVELEFAPPDKTKAIRFNKPIAPVPNMLPPLEPRISGRRVAAYVTGGLGIAGLLVSAVTGAVTWGQKGTIAENCNDGMPRICNAQGQSSADLAKTTGLTSTITIVAGAALLATGVILYATEPKPTRLGGAPARMTVGVNPSAGGARLVTTWAF